MLITDEELAGGGGESKQLGLVPPQATVWKKGDRVRVMDPYRFVVECFRGVVDHLDAPHYEVVIVPDFDRGKQVRVYAGPQLQRIDDNRLRRWETPRAERERLAS